MNEIVAVEYQLKGNYTIQREFFTGTASQSSSTQAHDAERALKLRYKDEINWSRVVSGTTVEDEYEKKYGIKKQQRLDLERQRQIDAQEKRLQELEAKTDNIDYQQQAENLKNEIENIFPNIQEWEEYKSSLEDEINAVIIEIRKKIDEFSEYSSDVQKSINTINVKIKEHNSQPNIYDSNKIDSLKNLDETLNTEIDFSEKIDEDLGLGGWIFIILILALILYGVDWFFELNIYSSVYEFIKNLFGYKI